MEQSKFPEGWSQERVRKVLEFYEEQKEDEAVAEDNSGIEVSEQGPRVNRQAEALKANRHPDPPKMR
jgi:hypothetical protein